MVSTFINFVTNYWYIVVAGVALVGFLVVKEKAKTSPTAASIVPQATTLPTPTPKAPVGQNFLTSSYPNAAALKSAIVDLKINYMVVLDSNIINTGFTPPQVFWTQKDGSVATIQPPNDSQVKPSAPVAAPEAPKPTPTDSVVAIAESTPVAVPVRNQYSGTDFTSKVQATACSLTDAYYLWQMRIPFKLAVQPKYNNAELHFAILAGTQVQISSVINEAGSTHAAEAAKFDVNTYTGVLKDRYIALVAGILGGSIVRKNFYSDTGQPV